MYETHVYDELTYLVSCSRVAFTMTPGPSQHGRSQTPAELLGFPRRGPTGAQLSWLLDAFVYADVGAMSPGRRVELRRALSEACGVLSEFGVWTARDSSDDDPADEMQAAQADAREVAEALAMGRHVVLSTADHAEHGDLVRPLRILGAEACAQPPNEHVYVRLTDAVALALFYGMLKSAPNIRRCPYATSDGRECGRVFVAVRAQQRCRPHAAARRREQNRAALKKHRKKTKRKTTTRRRR